MAGSGKARARLDLPDFGSPTMRTACEPVVEKTDEDFMGRTGGWVGWVIL
jgi:hypothetical protein